MKNPAAELRGMRSLSDSRGRVKKPFGGFKFATGTHRRKNPFLYLYQFNFHMVTKSMKVFIAIIPCQTKFTNISKPNMSKDVPYHLKTIAFKITFPHHFLCPMDKCR